MTVGIAEFVTVGDVFVCELYKWQLCYCLAWWSRLTLLPRVCLGCDWHWVGCVRWQWQFRLHPHVLWQRSGPTLNACRCLHVCSLCLNHTTDVSVPGPWSCTVSSIFHRWISVMLKPALVYDWSKWCGRSGWELWTVVCFFHAGLGWSTHTLPDVGTRWMSVLCCGRFDKAFTGRYIGDVARLLMLRLANDRLMFGGEKSSKLLEWGSFTAQHLSDIERSVHSV